MFCVCNCSNLGCESQKDAMSGTIHGTTIGYLPLIVLIPIFNQTYKQKEHIEKINMRSLSWIVPIPTRNKHFLIQTSVWDQRGNIGTDPVICYIKTMNKMCHTINIFHIIYRYDRLNDGLIFRKFLTATC